LCYFLNSFVIFLPFIFSMMFYYFIDFSLQYLSSFYDILWQLLFLYYCILRDWLLYYIGYISSLASRFASIISRHSWSYHSSFLSFCYYPIMFCADVINIFFIHVRSSSLLFDGGFSCSFHCTSC